MDSTHAETYTATNGARVEVGTIVHEGREFSAGGSIIDLEAGRITAYIDSDGKHATTWQGETIGRVVWHSTSRTGFYGATIHHYRIELPDGSEWYGKNGGFFGGAGCVINLRRALHPWS